MFQPQIRAITSTMVMMTAQISLRVILTSLLLSSI